MQIFDYATKNTSSLPSLSPMAVMLSIRPFFCQKIAVGEKLYEIRKNEPKIKPPFKCYIYCTKQKEKVVCNGISYYNDELYRLPNGEIKYGCSIELAGYNSDDYSNNNFLNGKVIGEFICDEIIPIFNVATDPWEYLVGDAHDKEKRIVTQSNLTEDELHKYADHKICYAWHISDFKPYLSPKALNDFSKYWDYDNNDKRPCESCEYNQFDYSENMIVCGYNFDGEGCPKMNLTRPPQSWCYVMEQENNE